MQRKYQLDTMENRQFLTAMFRDLLRFGENFPAPDGSAYWLGDDGQPWKDRPRDLYETARMAHVYALGAMLGFPGCEALTDAALRALNGSMRDRKNGGWFSGLNPDGSPRDNKLCYAHAFVILAAATARTAGRPGAAALLKDALEVYDRRFWNEEEGLSCDTWDTAFTKLDDYRGLNANMHTVEAFLAASDATGDETYRVRAGRIIRRVVGWASDNLWRIPEHFSKDWVADLECNRDKPDDPFKPYGATPGHGIEWARLIAQWALSSELGAAERSTFIDAACLLFDRAITDGWNADGAPGIVYTTDWNGAPVVHDRMHWTLAEAINTSAVLFRITDRAGYADRYALLMEYLDKTVYDHIHGSWFHQLDRQNQVMTTVWPGKPDLYHAAQAALIPYYEPRLSIATAVRQGKRV